ncbi:MAG: DUF3795 domain-containing protein [Armatimonadota bacterium]
MNLSICGIDCDVCKYKKESNCPGCHALKGKPFWGECDLYACATGKNLPHCGKCEAFPCEMLKEWASGENPERIHNLMELNNREA